MKAVSNIASLLLALTSLGDAVRLVKKAAPAVISAQTHKRPNVNPMQHDRMKHGQGLRRRQDVLSVSLQNEVTLYYIQATIGSNDDKFLLHIDTGSSDLWVNTPNSALCQRYAQYCDQAGVYDSSESTSYKLVAADSFNVTYADGSTAFGNYVTDTVTVGGSTLNNFQFGVATTSTSPEGILGIGYRTNEGAASEPNIGLYPNLPVALANAGVINSNAYSLFLDDLNANSGTILFGGVDTSKYSGELTTFPVLQTYGYYSELLIGMTGIGQNGNAGSLVSGQSLAVLLDSGTSLTYLPDDIVNALYSAYNTQYSSQYGAAPVDCSLANQDGSVDFTFDTLTIKVPLSELVVDISETAGISTCILGLASASGSPISILGDTFLRSAYVVYDLSNNEISMAQASYDNSNSNIQEIQAGADGVPDSTEASNPVTSVANVVTGAIGNVQATGVSGIGGDSGNAAPPMITQAPVWAAAGAAAAWALF